MVARAPVVAPGSIATTVPSIDGRSPRSSSSSRTSARLGPGFLRAHAFERRDDMRSRDAVGVLTHVALELAQGPVGGRPEHPVLAARVEPQRVQLALERADVVAAEDGRVQVQRAVAQPVAGLDQLAPGVGAHQRRRRAGCAGSWKARTAASVDGPNAPSASAASTTSPSSLRRCWMSLDLGALVAEVVDLHRTSLRCARSRPATRRTSRRSGDVRLEVLRRMASFGRAPITRATSSPSLNRISDGIDITPYVRVASGLSSMLSLTTFSASPLLLADLLDHRRDHVARHAPLRPEVHEHGGRRNRAPWSGTPGPSRSPMFAMSVSPSFVACGSSRAAPGPTSR